MPNGTLPIAGYLSDGQRTTSEFQGGIDELLAYVRTLKAEVDALSATVIKEAAVRGVGITAGDLTDISSSQSVWQGTPASIIPQSSLSTGGSGLYIIGHDTPSAGTWASKVYWDGSNSGSGTPKIAYDGSTLYISEVRISSTGTITSGGITVDLSGGSISGHAVNILFVKKV